LKTITVISKGFTSTCLLLMSLLGLCFIAILTFNGTISKMSYPLRKPLIGSIFGSICVLGTLSAVFPSKCSRIFHFKTENGRRTSNVAEPISLRGKNLQLRGHHPDCGNFSAHVFLVSDRIFCAGCVGLALGAVFSLLGTFLYFFANLSLNDGYYFVFWVGFIGVACGLLQYHVFRFKRSLIHMFLNSGFVLGASLLLVGADAITSSLSTAVYILALDIFWIYARIELSRWNHGMICDNCGLEKCPYYLRRRL